MLSSIDLPLAFILVRIAQESGNRPQRSGPRRRAATGYSTLPGTPGRTPLTPIVAESRDAPSSPSCLPGPANLLRLRIFRRSAPESSSRNALPQFPLVALTDFLECLTSPITCIDDP